MLTRRNSVDETVSLVTRSGQALQVAQPMNTLLGFTKMLNSSYRLEQQLSWFLKETQQMLGVDYAILHLYDDNKQELRSYFLWQEKLKQVRQAFGEGIPEYVIRNNKVVNVSDASADSRFIKGEAWFGQKQVKSFLLVPVNNRNGKATGCLQVLNKHRGNFDRKDTESLMFVAELVATAIQHALTYNDALACKRLEKELGRAVKIQRQLMPRTFPRLPGYEIFAFNQPAEYIGGDYYDFFPFSRTMSLVLADVSGKGFPAAILTANLHASLHSSAREIDSCKEVVRRINNHFYLHTASDMFATFFWANLNYDDHRLKYVNAGHIPPILIGADGQLRKLKSGGLPIGIMDSFEYEESEVTLKRGDTLLIFSDGITEIVNRTGEMFGKKALIDTVSQNYHLSGKELGKVVLRRVQEFCNTPTYPDDMTLMIVKRNA